MRIRVSVLAVALISRFAFDVAAQSSIPYTGSFEALGLGDSILTNPAAGTWDGTLESKAFVTNAEPSYSNRAPITFPLSSETHTNIVRFETDGLISNSFAASSLQTLWVDTMVQPVLSEEAPVSSAITNSQLSVYFGTNGYVSVFHGVDTNAPATGLIDTNFWSTFSNSGFRITSSGQWVRLTVQMYYNTDFSYAMFKAQVDGTVLSNEFGYSGTDLQTATQPGPWFLCANDTSLEGGLQLNEIALSGSGYLDDLLVTTNAPTFAQSITVIASAGGSVTPSGTLYFVSGASTNFVIQADPYWAISLVDTGAPVAGVQGLVYYDLPWSNIIGDSTLTVNFSEQVASNGVPYKWLVDHNVGTNNYPLMTWDELSVDDPDKDGMFNWQEWVAGTEPTDSNSLLKVLSQVISNGLPVITWLSSTNTLNGAPYRMQSSSNLLDGAGWAVITNIPADVAGTNTLIVTPAPLTTPTFFRVSITN